jgi:hypothetical protein
MIKVSRTQGAEEARSSYLNDLIEKGVRLSRDLNTREVVYRTELGKRVRIPFANEKTKGDAWWWGLPDNKEFEFIILLGKTHGHERLDFVLPFDFLSPVWESFSRDKQGGINFDIYLRARADYQLVLNRGRLKPVNEFLGFIEPLSR